MDKKYQPLMRDNEKMVTKNDNDGTKGAYENEATKDLNNEKKEEPGCTAMETNTKNESHTDTTIIEASDLKVDLSENCSYQRGLGKEVTNTITRDTTNLHETSAEPNRKLQASAHTCIKEIQENKDLSNITTSAASKRKVSEEDAQSKDANSTCYSEDLITQIERANNEYSKIISMLELKRQMLDSNREVVDNSYKESFNHNGTFHRENFISVFKESTNTDKCETFLGCGSVVEFPRFLI